jgi:hypothetical protein
MRRIVLLAPLAVVLLLVFSSSGLTTTSCTVTVAAAAGDKNTPDSLLYCLDTVQANVVTFEAGTYANLPMLATGRCGIHGVPPCSVGDPITLQGSTNKRGEPVTVLQGQLVINWQGMDVKWLRFSPMPCRGAPPCVRAGSIVGGTGSDVTYESNVFDGSTEPGAGVELQIQPRSANVTIGGSPATGNTFERCGDPDPDNLYGGFSQGAGRCIEFADAGNNTVIDDNTFVDYCYGCKLVHGNEQPSLFPKSSGIRITDNYFGKVPHMPGCGSGCQHLEAIHIEGGATEGLVVTGNTFSDCGYDDGNGPLGDPGADDHGNCTADIFDGTGSLNDATISGNAFTGTTNAAIFIGDFPCEWLDSQKYQGASNGSSDVGAQRKAADGNPFYDPLCTGFSYWYPKLQLGPYIWEAGDSFTNNTNNLTAGSDWVVTGPGWDFPKELWKAANPPFRGKYLWTCDGGNHC